MGADLDNKTTSFIQWKFKNFLMKPTIERVGTSAEHFFSYQAHLHISDYLLSSVTLGCALFLSKLGFSIFVNVLLYPSLNQLFSDLCFSQPAGQKVSGDITLRYGPR